MTYDLLRIDGYIFPAISFQYIYYYKSEKKEDEQCPYIVCMKIESREEIYLTAFYNRKDAKQCILDIFKSLTDEGEIDL